MRFQPRTAARECTAASLPSTRRAVFFDVLKLQFFKLSQCGLITLTAALPLTLLAMVRDGYQLSLYQQVQQGALTGEAASLYVSLFQNLSAVVQIPLLLLLSVALAGAGRVVKLLAWEEPVFFWHDFRRGLRQNLRQMLALGAMTGVVRFACLYAASRGFRVPGALALLILGPTAMYMAAGICVYDLPLLQQIRYALMLYAKQPLKTLAVCAMCAAAFLPQAIPSPYVRLVAGLLDGFLLPVVTLGWFCFCFAQMDRFINPGRYPGLVGRGLFSGEPEEAENGSSM